MLFGPTTTAVGRALPFSKTDTQNGQQQHPCKNLGKLL